MCPFLWFPRRTRPPPFWMLCLFEVVCSGGEWECPFIILRFFHPPPANFFGVQFDFSVGVSSLKGLVRSSSLVSCVHSMYDLVITRYWLLSECCEKKVCILLHQLRPPHTIFFTVHCERNALTFDSAVAGSLLCFAAVLSSWCLKQVDWIIAVHRQHFCPVVGTV